MVVGDDGRGTVTDAVSDELAEGAAELLLLEQPTAVIAAIAAARVESSGESSCEYQWATHAWPSCSARRAWRAITTQLALKQVRQVASRRGAHK